MVNVFSILVGFDAQRSFGSADAKRGTDQSASIATCRVFVGFLQELTMPALYETT